jgi:hypothetical protein
VDETARTLDDGGLVPWQYSEPLADLDNAGAYSTGYPDAGSCSLENIGYRESKWGHNVTCRRVQYV